MRLELVRLIEKFAYCLMFFGFAAFAFGFIFMGIDFIRRHNLDWDVGAVIIGGILIMLSILGAKMFEKLR